MTAARQSTGDTWSAARSRSCPPPGRRPSRRATPTTCRPGTRRCSMRAPRSSSSARPTSCSARWRWSRRTWKPPGPELPAYATATAVRSRPTAEGATAPPHRSFCPSAWRPPPTIRRTEGDGRRRGLRCRPARFPVPLDQTGSRHAGRGAAARRSSPGRHRFREAPLALAALSPRSHGTSGDRLGQPRTGARFARAERERSVTLPIRLVRFGSEPEPGAGGHHRRAPRAHGRDDLLRIDPLEVDRGRTEAGMAELTLNDVQRHALTRELERVRVTQLMRREPPPHARGGGEAPELAADTGARPRSSARRAVDDAEQW